MVLNKITVSLDHPARKWDEYDSQIIKFDHSSNVRQLQTAGSPQQT